MTNEFFKKKLNLNTFYKSFGRPVIIIESFIGMIIIIICMSTIASHGIGAKGEAAIGLEFVYTKEGFTSILNTLGENGVNVYKSAVLIDCLFPFMYSTFLASIIAYLLSLKNEHSKYSLIFFSFPFLAGLVDWVENIMHIIFMANVSAITDELVFISGLFSIMKWVFIFFSIIYIMFNFLLLSLKKLSIVDFVNVEKE